MEQERNQLDVWVINLDNAPESLERTIAPLRNMRGLVVRRFPAMRPNRDAKGLTALSSASPDKTVAIALSHRAVAAATEQASRGPVLVLEDDVFPLVKDLRGSIDMCMTKAQPGWDVILLNTAGPGCTVCEGERPGRLCGSAAAYLLSSQGARKLSSAAISWHTDIVRNSDAYDVRQGPALFGTMDVEPTGVVVGGRDLLWFARQPCLRWRNGTAVRAWVVALFSVLSILGLGFSAALSACGSGGTSVALGVPSAGVLASLTALAWHTSRDANYARCSRDSMVLFVVVFGALLLLAAFTLAKGTCPAASALCLFGSLLALFLVASWWDERRTTATANV
jgi:hypothetical protein